MFSSSCFRSGRLAGHGGFSRVYRAVYTPETGEPITVALKVLNASADVLQSNKAVMDELQLQYQLRSSYVVRCHGVTDTNARAIESSNGNLSDTRSRSGSVADVDNKSKFVIVMEYLAGGSLDRLLSHPDYRTLSSEGRAWLAQQVISAVHALSIEKIVHGDIKPLNFLWDVGANCTRPLVKISDFGTSKLQETVQSLSHTPANRTFFYHRFGKY